MIHRLLPWIGVSALIVLAGAAYVLTLDPTQEDPCAAPQNDVSGAILADDREDGDALANRAIIQRGGCPPQR